MDREGYNLKPLALRQARIYIDKELAFDMAECEVKFTTKTWSGHQLGDPGQSTRVTGYSISGTITKRRATTWGIDMIKEYIRTRKTPEFTLQCVIDDPDSDYQRVMSGPSEITLLGCVPTGDLSLFTAKADDDGIVTEAMTFNAYLLA